MQLRGVVLVLVVALIGCGNRAPSCKDALDEAARTLGDAAGLLKDLRAECERSGWTAEQRSCIASARDKGALAACAILLAAKRSQDESRAAQNAAQAQQEAMKRAQAAMNDVQGKLDQVMKDLEVFDARLMKAQDELISAQSDAARAAASGKLAALQKEKAGLEAQLAAAKTDVDKAAAARLQALQAAPR